MFYFKISSLVVLFVFFYLIEAGPVVVSTHGRIEGKVLKTLLNEVEYYGFTGIPYAAPPVKEFRFLPPRSVNPWTDILRATEDTQECVQFNNNVKKGQPLGHYGLENCLYLSIFTPNVNGPRRPIIVFLHNEYLKYSYNKTKDYSPDFFIEEDVVIATISHRLSVFGFLSLEDDVLQGNSGLRDIVAGLEWISNNAELFGGDRNRITLLGSQGGAAAVDLLIHSKARKLFNSAILQGGTAWFSLYLQDSARERALKLADLFEIYSKDSSKVLKGLSEIEPGDLLAKELETIHADYNKEHQRGLLPFGPVVERERGLITDYPERSSQIDLPVLIGFNSREGLEKSLQYLIEPKYLSFVEKDFVLLMPKRVGFRLNPSDNAYEAAVKDVKNFYFPKGKVTPATVSEYATYMGDVFAVPINEMVEHYANISSEPVYYYYFDYYSDLSENKNDIMNMSSVQEGMWGAASGDELCYLFKCPRLKRNYLKHNKAESEEITLLKKLVRMWSNFAKLGNPTPKNDVTLEGLHWPSYTNKNKEYLHINGEMRVKHDLLEKQFDFWESIMKKWEINAVKCNAPESSRSNIDEL